MNLNTAVGAFESKVAPANYKRPTALITQGMIKKAQEKVTELGIQDSLQRRHAHIDDITINNVLFANRNSKAKMDIFDDLTKGVPVNPQVFARAEEISIDDFIKDILPKTQSIELLMENKHINNLINLIAPEIVDAPNILKWRNNFSWSYNGEVTDSIKERVAKAGGNVTGVVRCSLSWFNLDDLDVHVREPGGTHIHFGNKLSPTGGNLDVDMNVNVNYASRDAVENITWPNKSRMLEGEYQVYVNNYAHRESKDFGFDFEIEYDGVIHSYHYPQEIQTAQNVLVAEFIFTRKNGIVFGKTLKSTQGTKEVWNLATQNFQEVSVIMHSPNHWDGYKTGNKHWFFMLKDCINPDDTRGLYNEFLKDELHEHRKVFEVLGSKLRVPYVPEQLSGLGFSSTKRNQVTCRVSGHFNRILKINF
jgi:hypothetical protein